MPSIEINGRVLEAQEGEMLLGALKRAGVHVPTLCHVPGLSPSGACRLCSVEVEGMRNLVPSCAYPVQDGMKVKTHSPRAVRARKTIVELLLANHPDDCNYCVRNNNCELQTLAGELGVRLHRYGAYDKGYHLDLSSPALVRDPGKCILCGRCVRVCEEVQSVACIDFVNRGSQSIVSTAFNQGLNISSCVNCGQCIMVCPTGALREQSHVKNVVAALEDPNKIVVVQHAPAVSVSLADEFGLKPGEDIVGRMTAALRRLGFKYVFPTSFSADLTIMEEASELAHRIANGGVLPMMTSCSPGWIRFVEQFFPDRIPNLSTCKSPQQMLGAIVKSHFAEKNGLSPKDIYSVSLMPCTAKKMEAARPEMIHDGVADIDAVLTTREAARLIRRFGVDLLHVDPEPADAPFGQRSTAGKLFGGSGGVMEAALRTAHYLLTGKDLERLEFDALRGLDGFKQTSVEIAGKRIGVAVVNGLKNARTLLEELREGRDDLHFVEVMTCPGGCVGGGGQPHDTDRDVISARMQKLYQIDASEALRLSHRNPDIQRLYEDFLGAPLSERSHHLLHTHYSRRSVVA
ncbi:MAG: NADH-dependent [FeFe] hydrogenase, group A6 [Myxococcota bacterium]|jgi:iron-only hydrogenase group A|nr:NADH-dependent [FeFe] hydrogenase, group A6 [Myxococcota bacterium]